MSPEYDSVQFIFGRRTPVPGSGRHRSERKSGPPRHERHEVHVLRPPIFGSDGTSPSKSDERYIQVLCPITLLVCGKFVNAFSSIRCFGASLGPFEMGRYLVNDHWSREVAST